MGGLGESLALMGDGTPTPKGFSLDALPPEALFRFADRRCRLAADPLARDLLLRSSALGALGQDEAAVKDLRAAAARDADDPMVSRTLLARENDEARKTDAAHALIANPRSSDGDLQAALRHFAAVGTEVALRAQRIGSVVFGWVARLSETPPHAEMRHEDGAVPIRLVERDDARSPPFGGRLSTFSFEWDPQQPCEITVTGQDGGTAVVRLHAIEAPDFVASAPEPAQIAPTRVTVIVPLYRDFEAAKACLGALALQESDIPLDFTLVDDHSPDPDISALAERFCRLHEGQLIVNSVNHGFAGAVNAAISLVESGDILLLNADVTLPPGAIDRLIRAAYGSPDIGTVMPLSNDSELTSFPIPFKPNPLPSSDLAIRIDDAARRANGERVVDIVNTIGFCVYIKRDCLRATGLLSQDYGRGYYEDVEIALKAREKGFRNVAAVGIYVAHGSGRSFREEKGALVSRNLPIVCDRFPRFREESEAFVRSDPLRAARGAIEAHLPPTEPTHMLVGASAPPGSPLSFRAQRIIDEGGFVLMVSWRQTGEGIAVDIRAPAGFGPRSLEVSLEGAGLERLSTYVLALRLVQIELCDLHALPSPLYRLLLRTSAPILFFVASLEDAMLVDSGTPAAGQGRLTSRDITVDFLGFDRDSDVFAYRIPQFLMRGGSEGAASKFVTADSMAQAWCADMRHRDHGSEAERTPKPVRCPARWDAKRLIAVPLPLASPAVDRLLLDIARHLRPRVDTRLIVLGRCLDDRALMAVGNVHVTGPASLDEQAQLIAACGADALFLPYRTSLFGVMEALSARVPLPRAYFDWSRGAMPIGAEDFVLDCRLGIDLICSEFARWCEPSDIASGVPS